ncbi:MAG: saccharopine dehydrogenase family protein [Promethearchaeota archaeon]
MKVFILGGYGAVGIQSAKLLAGSDLITEIAIAGRNFDRAQKTATEIGGKARAVQIDGMDSKLLSSLVEGFDILVNVASNGVALPALEAAIRTGIHYCDIGWGKDFITSMLELADKARKASIIAVICAGAAPCLTNIMSVHAVNQLDETKQIHGGMSLVFDGTSVLTPQQWLKTPKESFIILQQFKPFLNWMFEVAHKPKSRTALVYRKGHWVEVDPLTDGLQIPLPKGGTVIAYPYSSADPLFGSWPVDLATTSPVEIFYTPFPPQLHDFYCEQIKRVTAGEINPESATNTFFETVEADPKRWLSITDDFVVYPLYMVTAVGHKKGRAAQYSCWFSSSMWIEENAQHITSAPLAVTVLRILRGEIEENGVSTAEKIFEPQPFLNEVASLMPELSPDEKLIGESFEWLE